MPGQFFMLEAPGRLLPRPFSVCLAPPGELAFLVDAIGPGTEAIAALEPGDEIARLRPARQRLPPRRRAAAPRRRRDRHRAAPVPRRAARRHAAHRRRLPHRRARRSRRRSCPARRGRRRPSRLSPSCRPGGLGRARVRPGADAARGRARRCPTAQLAWEAPMACGYGACYGCVVEIDGAAQASLRRSGPTASAVTR